VTEATISSVAIWLINSSTLKRSDFSEEDRGEVLFGGECGELLLLPLLLIRGDEGETETMGAIGCTVASGI
jgi:hypothetical protein